MIYLVYLYFLFVLMETAYRWIPVLRDGWRKQLMHDAHQFYRSRPTIPTTKINQPLFFNMTSVTFLDQNELPPLEFDLDYNEYLVHVAWSQHPRTSSSVHCISVISVYILTLTSVWCIVSAWYHYISNPDFCPIHCICVIY